MMKSGLDARLHHANSFVANFLAVTLQRPRRREEKSRQKPRGNRIDHQAKALDGQCMNVICIAVVFPRRCARFGSRRQMSRKLGARALTNVI